MVLGLARTSSAVRRSADRLSRPGPHEVLRGDLALVGLPGLVLTPREGLGLPAVAFGHDWLQPPSRYVELLRHLASWGVVAACPGTQRGPVPSHRAYAADLRTTLDVCSGVRLGDGAISVDPARLGLAGHGTGGGAAVLAAAADERCRAVATLAVTDLRPSAREAARSCRVPALHLAAGKDRVAPPSGHAEPVSTAWAGPSQLRVLPGASHLGFAAGRHWTDVIVDGGPGRGTLRLAKVLLTAFFLRHLTGDREHDALLSSALPGAPLPEDD